MSTLVEQGIQDAEDLQIAIRSLQQSVDAFVALGDSAVTLALTDASFVRTKQQVNRLVGQLAVSRAAMFTEVSNDALTRITDLVDDKQQIYALEFKVTPLKRDELFRALQREYIVGTKFQEWISHAQGQDFKAIRQMIRMGFLNGRTSLEVLQSIKGTQRQAYRDGVLIRAHRSVASLVTTATNMLMNFARLQIMASAGVTQWRLAIIVDDNTSDETKAQQDQVYEIGKGPSLPIHINGRALAVPANWRPVASNP